jgi:CcmD family protein
MYKNALFTLALVLASSAGCLAQTEMADTMRSNGKIYVVVVVLATIFAGIFAYLVYLDRKMTRIENEK